MHKHPCLKTFLVVSAFFLAPACMHASEKKPKVPSTTTTLDIGKNSFKSITPKTDTSKPKEEGTKPDDKLVHLFSRWEDGSCELIGDKLAVLGEGTDVVIDLKGKPINAFCSSDEVALLYPDKIELRGPPKHLKNRPGMTSASLKQVAIGGTFVNDGEEAIVAFESGQVQYLWFTEEGCQLWTSDNPKSEEKLKEVRVKEVGKIISVEFTETGTYFLFFRDCDGILRSVNGNLPQNGSLNCVDNQCQVKDDKGEMVNELDLSCSDQKEKQKKKSESP